jgi:glycerophosphoryl diester phosphodiesterase
MRGAVHLGATAIETDVRVTADGEVVCVHDARVGLRRRPVEGLSAERLPAHVPTLRAVLTDPALCALPLSVDVKAPGAWGPTLAIARELGVGQRLWLCASVAELREVAEEGLGLVVSVRRERLDLDDLGPVQAVNLRWDQWDRELLARVHGTGREALAWGLRGGGEAERRMLTLGVDGIYGDDVGAMVRAAQAS